MGNEKPAETGFTRRELLATAVGGAAGAVLLGACGSSPAAGASDATVTGGTDAATPTADGAPGSDGTAGQCTVYPQETQGPFYLDLDMVRPDVTEGKPGAPLHIVVQVVQAPSCAPLAGVAIDIWQCDAAGVYSGYPGQLGGLDTTGETFLRGTQLTGADGKLQFTTIYPGWYPGRTTHIHFKVHVTPTREAVSQMYFPEDVTSALYGTTSPYAARGQKDTSNLGDGAVAGNLPPLFAVEGDPDGYQATLRVVVAG